MGLVELARYLNWVEADFARRRLAADGIETFLFDEATSLPEGPMLPVRLMVLEEEYEIARRSLETDDPS
jgi:Putative prokaryotic signal transducing protein